MPSSVDAWPFWLAQLFSETARRHASGQSGTRIKRLCPLPPARCFDNRRSHMRSATAASLAFLLIGPMSVFPNLAAAQSQDASSSIDDSDGIFIDGRTFRITHGKGKLDALWAVKGLAARELRA